MDEVVINVVNRVGNEKVKIINKSLCVLFFTCLICNAYNPVSNHLFIFFNRL